MAVVVRCTGCGGLARVGPEAVGLLVVCPRCHDPFLADPVPEPVSPAPAPPPPPPRPVRAMPVAPPPRRRRPPVEVTEHAPPADGVPFSVIIGLALLPLTIPMLWLIGPVAVGNPSALTLATPVSLAVAASVLCLAVAYTVDWTAATRIKGVLTLVGLAFLTGLFLYFMKRDWAEWFQTKLGETEWQLFVPDDDSYTVDLPGQPTRLPPGPVGPVPALKNLTGYQLTAKKSTRTDVFLVAAGPDHDPQAGDAAWFAAVGQSLKDAHPAAAVAQTVEGVTTPHRQWEVPGNEGRRVVRVLRSNGRVYLLTVQGRRVSAMDEHATRFLDSFAPAGAGD
ncbi:MAG: hypothetical protein U0804_21440 [Gemmataceae bacterium]